MEFTEEKNKRILLCITLINIIIMYIISIKIHTIREINPVGIILVITINLLLVIFYKKFISNKLILTIILFIYFFSIFLIPAYKYEINKYYDTDNPLRIETIKKYKEINYYNCYNIKINKTSAISGM